VRAARGLIAGSNFFRAGNKPALKKLDKRTGVIKHFPALRPALLIERSARLMDTLE
jgi:hypothetical protein